MAVLNHRDSFPGRVFYRAGGGVKFGLFLAWLMPAITAAALLAVLLFWLYLNGYYYLIIMPAAAGIGVSALVRLALIKGHCRNRLLGGFAGLCAAAVLYGGYFYCGMVYHWGPRVAARLDLLPVYVKARMKTDVVRDASRPAESGTRSTGMNWYTFSFEAGFVLFIGIFPGIRSSRRPYCEACGRWMTRHATTFNPKTSTAVIDALRTSSSQGLAGLCEAPVYLSVPNLTLGVDVCPSSQEGSPRGCPVYISVKQVTQSQGLAHADPIDQATGKLLLRTLQATSSEMAALAPRFKLLESVAGSNQTGASL
jgi:hypothetical protein